MLTSGHSITIYEWLKKWVKIGIKEIPVFELKEKLGVHESKSYENFKDFRKRVLEPAIKEINEKSDLIFHYETKKERQKIVSLIFHIQLKNQDETVVIAVEPLQTSIKIEEPLFNPLREKLIEDLSPWIHRDQAELIIDKVNCDEKLISSSIKLYHDKQKAGSKIVSPSGFIIASIINGYGLPTQAEEKKELEKQLKLEAQKKAEQEKNEKEAKSKEESKKAWEEFEAMPENEKTILIYEVISEKGSIFKDDFKKRGIKSVLVKKTLPSEV